ncbi:uncharacterized protein isoform X2 [Rhodnius prolixus]|uniref:uncharacterized protein isoform X2 n=1 Tax=Rhodnius prolixus TaxID=13249 RepID=UPI003D1877B0
MLKSICKNIQIKVLQWAEEALIFWKFLIEDSIKSIHKILRKQDLPKTSPFNVKFWLFLGLTCLGISIHYCSSFLRRLVVQNWLWNSVITEGGRFDHSHEYSRNSRAVVLKPTDEVPVITITSPHEWLIDKPQTIHIIHKNGKYYLKKSIPSKKEPRTNSVQINIVPHENLIGRIWRHHSTSTIRKDVLIVLDLDGTLVHSHRAENDFFCKSGIPCPFITQRGKLCTHVRQHLHYFIRKLDYFYTVAVWSTASYSYVNWIVEDVLPAEVYWHKVFSKNQLDYNKSAMNLRAVAFKNLEKLNWELKNIICIDDRAYTYRFCEENLVWIRRWKGQHEDVTSGLVFLLKVLSFLLEKWPANVTQGIRYLAREFPLKL